MHWHEHENTNAFAQLLHVPVAIKLCVLEMTEVWTSVGDDARSLGISHYSCTDILETRESYYKYMA